MPNEFYYAPQFWGEPIEGEILSLNAQYVGQKLGTPTMDAAVDVSPEEQAYSTEFQTVHVGTVMQDAIEGSTPKLG